MLMPLLRLMRNRAPKLTARTFYAPLLRFMHNRATNRLKCAETAVHHISQTPPEAGTRRGMAPESLCAPSAYERPLTAVRYNQSERAKLFLLFSHLNLK